MAKEPPAGEANNTAMSGRSHSREGRPATGLGRARRRSPWRGASAGPWVHLAVWWYRSRILRLAALCALGALLATVVVWLAERNVPSSEYNTYSKALRGVIVLLFSGWDVEPPTTAVGFWAAFMALVFGLVFVASLTAEIASIWVEQRLKRSGEVRRVKLSGHVVICNNSPHLRLVVRQLLDPQCLLDAPVVVLADAIPDDVAGLPRVIFVKGDPTDDDALQRAGIHRARAAIILATDLSDPAASDSRAVLTALAVEALNPSVYTVVEIVNPANAKHLAHARVDEIVSATELGAKLAVQATLHPGLARFIDSLLTFDENGEFYVARVPDEYVGLSAAETLQRMYADYGCILIGLVSDDEMCLLPAADRRLEAGDSVVVLALSPPEFMDR